MSTPLNSPITGASVVRMVLATLVGGLTAVGGSFWLRTDPGISVLWNRILIFAGSAGMFLLVFYSIRWTPLASWNEERRGSEWIFYGTFLLLAIVVLFLVWAVPYSMDCSLADDIAANPAYALFRSTPSRLQETERNTLHPEDLDTLAKEADSLRRAVLGDEQVPGILPTLRQKGMLPVADRVFACLVQHHGWQAQDTPISNRSRVMYAGAQKKNLEQQLEKIHKQMLEIKTANRDPTVDYLDARLSSLETLADSITIKDDPILRAFQDWRAGLDGVNALSEDSLGSASAEVSTAWATLRDTMAPALKATRNQHVHDPIGLWLMELKTLVATQSQWARDGEAFSTFDEKVLTPLKAVLEQEDLIPDNLDLSEKKLLEFQRTLVLAEITTQQAGGEPRAAIPVEIVRLQERLIPLVRLSRDSPESVEQMESECLDAWGNLRTAVGPALTEADKKYASELIGVLGGLLEQVHTHCTLAKQGKPVNSGGMLHYPAFDKLDDEQLRRLQTVLEERSWPTDLDAQMQGVLEDLTTKIVKAIEAHRNTASQETWKVEELLAHVKKQTELVKWKPAELTWKGTKTNVHDAVQGEWDTKFRNPNTAIYLPKNLDRASAIRRAMAIIVKVVQQYCLDIAREWEAKAQQVKREQADPVYKKETRLLIRSLWKEDPYWGEGDRIDKELRSLLDQIGFSPTKAQVNGDAPDSEIKSSVEENLRMLGEYIGELKQLGNGKDFSRKAHAKTARWWTIFHAGGTGKAPPPFVLLSKLVEGIPLRKENPSGVKAGLHFSLNASYVDELLGAEVPLEGLEPDSFKRSKDRKEVGGSSPVES